MSFLQDARYVALVVALVGANALCAQRTQSQPTNDSAAQASPIGPVLHTPATDSSEQASPIAQGHRSGRGVAPHTAVRIVLNEGIDSGTLKNGQTVTGKLTSITPPPRTGGTKVGGASTVKTGTPVTLSVIATVPAGKLNAVGEMSLELVQIGKQSVYTDVQTFRGKPGTRDLPDSAPTMGTNAGLPAGTELTFTVQAEPGFTEPAPKARKDGPGSVTGLSSGSKPANFGQPVAASSNAGNTQAGGGSANAANNGTPLPVQHAGQVTTSPNQPASPMNASPTTTTQPH